MKPASLVSAATPAVCSSPHAHTRTRKQASKKSELISARGQRLHPPAPVARPRTQHVGSRQHDAENCSRPAPNESSTQPSQPWPQQRTYSSPPSPSYSSSAPSAPISPSSSSEATGPQGGRDYGCSRRRAAVRCTSVSQHSIASMVSTPRDMAFSRYHCAGKSRAHSPLTTPKTTRFAAASPTGTFFRSRDTRRISHPCPPSIMKTLLVLQ